MQFSDTQLAEAENQLITALRVSLGVIFLWFGTLKLLGYNPVFEIINGTFPFLADGVGVLVLGGFEVLIGLALLLNYFKLIVHTVLVLHLIGTFLVFVGDPGLMFHPSFPVLSLEGEFVVKNIILALSGLVILVREQRKAKHHTASFV